MILTLRNVSKSYRQARKTISVLSDIELSVDAGETVAVMGRSGSGKSTLLSLVSGILKPDAGDIELRGRAYDGLDENALADLRAEQIGFVFQNFHLVSYLTALENVSLPLRVGGRRTQGDPEARDLLARIGLADRLDHLPRQLSGGEQQRVAVARALIHRPGLVLADEPSGNLDETTGDEIMDLLFGLVRDTGAGMILVTHSRAVAERCDRLLLLDKGRLRPGAI